MLVFYSALIATLCALIGCNGVAPSDGLLPAEKPSGEVDLKTDGVILHDKDSECNTENGTCHTHKLEKRNAAVVGKACDCGPHSVGCTFVEDKKICTCEYGYGQAPNGTCIIPCGCKNDWSSCRQNLCVCRHGDLYGDRCENIRGCEGLSGPNKCGDPIHVTCTYGDQSRGGCGCVNPDHIYSSRNRICGKCDCGNNGKCSLNEAGKPECECDKDYVVAEEGAYLEGECRRCDCGPNVSIFDRCKFNSTGKFCNCKNGFSQRGGKCVACTCGEHGKCSFDGYRKVCTCDKGYVMQDGECVVCDCGPHCSCYYENGEKISSCNPDAIEFGGKCVECNCGLDGSCALDSEGKKTCTCDQYFGDREGYCIDCQCFFDDKIVECSFTNKTQICHCPAGYKATDFFCLPESQ